MQITFNQNQRKREKEKRKRKGGKKREGGKINKKEGEKKEKRVGKERKKQEKRNKRGRKVKEKGGKGKGGGEKSGNCGGKLGKIGKSLRGRRSPEHGAIPGGPGAPGMSQNRGFCPQKSIGAPKDEVAAAPGRRIPGKRGGNGGKSRILGGLGIAGGVGRGEIDGFGGNSWILGRIPGFLG